MGDSAEISALREQVAMLSQQVGALSATAHALLLTVATPGTAQHLARLLTQHAAGANAPALPEQVNKLFADMRQSLLAAAERGRISSASR